ncbi:Sec7 domain GEF [Ephemerocybe angulata]|uniref:Sec7 domain GEF n=1 Tax=Ephemerocybe angulata TaxID=980116 RepID=A0A8H6MEN7_9AGAR|nr:Sec7 domain GEF [Tulosesus angulatus]
MDFEQALMNEGTMRLQEGIDMSQLGVFDTSMDSSMSSPFSSPAAAGSKGYGSGTIRQSPAVGARKTVNPATPTIVPPTPGTGASSVNSVSTVGNGAGHLGRAKGAGSPSSSSHELFYDADDGASGRSGGSANASMNNLSTSTATPTNTSNLTASNVNTNRRSIYRSPGTSSSPDLATLLRKAKEKGDPVSIQKLKKEYPHSGRPKQEAPPMPEREYRPRSSTTSGPSSTPSSPALAKTVGRGDSLAPMGSKSGKEYGTKSKSSVRNFFGKMLGQSSVRERSKTDASLQASSSGPSYTSNSGHTSVFGAFPPPPVPPLPQPQRSHSGSPIADVFTTSNRPHLDTSKPLPTIVAAMGNTSSSHSPVPDDGDDRSMVFVDKKTPISSSTIKRRSLSVGQADLKPPDEKRPDTGSTDDSHLHGILNEFRGQLSQLDPIAVQNPTLDLRDPSTPARQHAYRKKSIVIPPRTSSLYSPAGPHQPRSPTSHVGSNGAASTSSLSNSVNPAVSPRLSSGSGYGMGMPSSFNHGKALPSRAHSGPASGMLSPGGGRDGARLRVLHRSTASSSEPSLLPALDDVRLMANARRTSHQDLTLNTYSDPTSPRFAMSSTLSPGSNEDTADMETRGKELASRCFNDNDDFLPKEKIAEWLGGHGRINKVALHHYMDFYDFAGLRLDLAFRRLCAKLYLKGETQQVDRILEEFSRRYWECNPGGVYGSANIVHAVSYSLLLLNTDLHVADLSTRMSRSQFVRNTLTAIQTQLNPASPDLGSSSSADLTSYDDCSVRGGASEDNTDGVPTIRSKRSDSITSWNSVSRDPVTGMPTTPSNASIMNGSTNSFHNGNGHDVGTPTSSAPTYGRAWEVEMESLLKEMYNAIKSQQILQPLASMGRSSMSSLSPGGAAVMRNRSLRTAQQDRLTTLKRGSIPRAASGVSPYSSNSSITDGRVSPSPSFATSQHEAMYGSSSSFLNPTLGFASNLSHTIIKEAQEDDDRSVRSDISTSTTISISDEELALLGAPWAKEGMLCRKQYWESAGKRAKDKTWLDVFVVIQKGELSMFVFGDHTSGASGTFGGGNWLANAQSVGSVHLSHSLAHPLPPPGYNRQRPHCMVLTLSNGGVYFFQAGTEELVNEWVSTCNYWAARTSKEPLAGGVSNMEYGWSRIVDLNGQRASVSQTESLRERDYDDSISVKSGRSGHSKFKWRGDPGTVRGPPSPWGDKIFINDWKPPMPPSVASTHDEETQLDALRKHVASMKKDLEVHNELREPVMALYQPRTANAMKAHSNWEKKSQYLLTEIVKYDSYIDSLQAAMSLRLKKRGEKALEHALNGGNSLDDRPTKTKYTGPDEDTIDEEVEPLTPGPRQNFPADVRVEASHYD